MNHNFSYYIGEILEVPALILLVIYHHIFRLLILVCFIFIFVPKSIASSYRFVKEKIEDCEYISDYIIQEKIKPEATDKDSTYSINIAYAGKIYMVEVPKKVYKKVLVEEKKPQGEITLCYNPKQDTMEYLEHNRKWTMIKN